MSQEQVPSEDFLSWGSRPALYDSTIPASAASHHGSNVAPSPPLSTLKPYQSQSSPSGLNTSFVPKQSYPKSGNGTTAGLRTPTTFRSLPVELRLRIWNYCIRPRVIPISSRKRVSKLGVPPTKPYYCYSWIPPPAILWVCHESREEALKFYRPQFCNILDKQPMWHPLYFNPSIDTLFFVDTRALADFMAFLHKWGESQPFSYIAIRRSTWGHIRYQRRQLNELLRFAPEPGEIYILDCDYDTMQLREPRDNVYSRPRNIFQCDYSESGGGEIRRSYSKFDLTYGDFKEMYVDEEALYGDRVTAALYCYIAPKFSYASPEMALQKQKRMYLFEDSDTTM